MNKLSEKDIAPAGAIVIPPKVRKKKFDFFIKIDVSKNKLDFALLADNQFVVHRVIKNNPDEISVFIGELKSVKGFKMSKAVFTMEQTGFYCNHLLDSLQKLKACITVENPMQIKNTLGVVRGKNDKIDALRIAQFAQRYQDELKLWVPKRPVILQLINLFAIRNRLLGVSVALKTPLAEKIKFIKKAYSGRAPGPAGRAWGH
jgi:transposase